VKQCGEAQAQRYIAALWSAMEEIKQSPDRWRVRNDIHPGCRARISGRHLIIYRSRAGTVEIGRILHGSMRLPDHLPTDFMGESPDPSD
jgi:plasmid stabilization system protein ParE